MSAMRTLLVPAPLVPGPVILSGEEARHGAAVLRLRPGDAMRLADGAGHAAVGTVSRVGRDTLEVVVSGVENLPLDPAELLTVVVAAPKGERLADLVRMLTELGVGRIAPLICARGERVPGNNERLTRIAAEALKQSRRARLPIVAEPLTVAEAATLGQRLVVLDPLGAAPVPGPVLPTMLVVGPEGGLTPEELATLAAAGAVATRLAGPILRIETAAVAAAAVWAAAWSTPPSPAS